MSLCHITLTQYELARPLAVCTDRSNESLPDLPGLCFSFDSMALPDLIQAAFVSCCSLTADGPERLPSGPMGITGIRNRHYGE